MEMFSQRSPNIIYYTPQLERKILKNKFILNSEKRAKTKIIKKYAKINSKRDNKSRGINKFVGMYENV